MEQQRAWRRLLQLGLVESADSGLVGSVGLQAGLGRKAPYIYFLYKKEIWPLPHFFWGPGPCGDKPSWRCADDGRSAAARRLVGCAGSGIDPTFGRWDVPHVSALLRTHSLSRKHSFAGGVAGSVAVVALHPFDVIKTRLQGRHAVRELVCSCCVHPLM